MSIPIEEGYHWWRLSEDYEWEPRLIAKDGGGDWCVIYFDADVIERHLKCTDCGGEWGERIPYPEESVQKMHELADTQKALELAVRLLAMDGGIPNNQAIYDDIMRTIHADNYEHLWSVEEGFTKDSIGDER